MNNTWLAQKLAQNGFTFEDLSAQTSISVEDLEKLSQTERGDSLEWNTVLSVLNDYPSVRIPSSSILDDLNNDLNEYPDGQAQCFYGFEDGAAVFTGYINLDDGQYHGSNTAREYLSSLTCSLQDALTLFTRQNAAANG